MPADLFENWVGHVEGGKDAFDAFSGLSTVQLMREIAEEQESLLARLEIQPIKVPGFQREYRKIPRDYLKLEDKPGSDQSLAPNFWQDEKFMALGKLKALEDGFLRLLSKLTTGTPLSSDALLCIVTYSAVTRGGLYAGEFLGDYLKQLGKSDFQFNAANDRIYVNLTRPATNELHNFRDENGNPHVRFRFEPDLLTLSLTILYCRNYLGSKTQKLQVVWTKLCNAFIDGGDTEAGTLSLDQFCKAAVWTSETVLGANVSRCVVASLGRQIYHFCMDETSFLNRLRDPAPISLAKFGEISPTEIADLSATMMATAGDDWHKPLKTLVSQALNSAASRQEAIDNLTVLLRADHVAWSESVRLFLSWLMFKLERTIKETSASTYQSLLWDRWISSFGAIDMAELEADELLEGFQKVLSSAKDQEERRELLGHLQSLYTFGMERFDLVADSKLSRFRQKSKLAGYVRTSVVDHRHLWAVLRALDTLTASPALICQLKLITIFAFRLGLRPSEIVHLRFKDIVTQGDWPGFVRSSLKTQNSRRSFIISGFLSEEEFRLFRDYFSRMRVGREPGDLLFGYMGENVVIDTGLLNRVVGNAFRQTTQNPNVVFYSLRHSFATSMQYILEGAWELAEAYTGFNREVLATIRRAFLKENESRDSYWAGSRALGHATPATSVSTYMHGSADILFDSFDEAVWLSSELRMLLKRHTVQDTYFNFRDGELNKLGRSGVRRRFIQRFPELFKHQQFETALEPAPPLLTCEITRGLMWYENAIQKANQAPSIQNVADELVIDARALGKLSEMAAILNGTRSKASRGFKYHGGCADIRTRIPKPKSPNAAFLSQLVFAHLNDLARNGQVDEIVRWSDAVLQGFTFNKSHFLSVRDVETFDTITGMLKGFVDYNQWYGSIGISRAFQLRSAGTKRPRRMESLLAESMRSNRVAESWRQRTEKFPRIAAPVLTRCRYVSRNPNGILKLGLSHLPASKMPENGRQEGILALVYVAFIAKCLWGSETSGYDAETRAMPGETNLMGQDMDAA